MWDGVVGRECGVLLDRAANGSGIVRALRFIAAILLIGGRALTCRAGYMHAKAKLAGALIRRSREQSGAWQADAAATKGADCLALGIERDGFLGCGKKRGFVAARGNLFNRLDGSFAHQERMIEIVDGGANVARQEIEGFADLRRLGSLLHG